MLNLLNTDLGTTYMSRCLKVNTPIEDFEALIDVASVVNNQAIEKLGPLSNVESFVIKKRLRVLLKN